MHLAALGDTAETLQGAWHTTHKQDLRPTAAPEAMEPPGVGDQQALILGQELENRRGHRGPGMKTPAWLAMTDRIRRQPKHEGTLVFPRAVRPHVPLAPTAHSRRGSRMRPCQPQRKPWVHAINSQVACAAQSLVGEWTTPLR